MEQFSYDIVDIPRDFNQFKAQIQAHESEKSNNSYFASLALEDFGTHKGDFLYRIKNNQIDLIFDTLMFDEYFKDYKFTHNVVKGFGLLLIICGVIVLFVSFLIKLNILIGLGIIILGIAVNRFGQYRKVKFFHEISNSLKANLEDDFSFICFYYFIGALGFKGPYGVTFAKMYPSHALNGRSEYIA